MNTTFIIAFGICFIGYLFHTLIHFFEYKDKEFIRSKFVDALFHILIFSGYIAWTFMLIFDRSIIPVSPYISLSVGLLFGVLGFIFFILSTIQKRGFEEIDELITTGIYNKLRNPMYIGIILIHIGFPFAFRRLFTLLSAVLWIGMILLWKYWEEVGLEEIFGEEYIEYKRKTIF